jgi:hypothetical protein
MMATSDFPLPIFRIEGVVDDIWHLITADHWTLFPGQHDDMKLNEIDRVVGRH